MLLQIHVHVDMPEESTVLMKRSNVVVVNAVVQQQVGHVSIANVTPHVQHRVIHIIRPLMDFVIRIKATASMF